MLHQHATMWHREHCRTPTARTALPYWLPLISTCILLRLHWSHLVTNWIQIWWRIEHVTFLFSPGSLSLSKSATSHLFPPDFKDGAPWLFNPSNQRQPILPVSQRWRKQWPASFVSTMQSSLRWTWWKWCVRRMIAKVHGNRDPVSGMNPKIYGN